VAKLVAVGDVKVEDRIFESLEEELPKSLEENDDKAVGKAFRSLCGAVDDTIAVPSSTVVRGKISKSLDDGTAVDEASRLLGEGVKSRLVIPAVLLTSPEVDVGSKDNVDELTKSLDNRLVEL